MLSLARRTNKNRLREAGRRASDSVARRNERPRRKKEAFRAIDTRKAFVSAEKQVRANACHHGCVRGDA